jgi:hypothetical protein
MRPKSKIDHRGEPFLVVDRDYFYPKREPANKFMERFGGEKFDPKRRGNGSNCDGESERA